MTSKKDTVKGVWAPKTSQLKGGATSPGQVSFEAYFLRDLYKQGKIDDKLLAEVIEQNKLPVNVKDVVAAIKDVTGASIPRGLVSHIADIASVISQMN